MDETSTAYYAVGVSGDGATYYYACGDDYEIDLTGNTISSVTRADVENIFLNKLRPGDVIAVLLANDEGDDSFDGGHDMMFIGDVDGDGVGEIMHSWGAKYNNAYTRTSVSDKSYITTDTFSAATAQDSYTESGETINFTRGSDKTYYAVSASNTKNYLKGYDIYEATKGWYSSTGTGGVNATGQAGTGFIGRNGGGTLTIEDWIARLGYRTAFADASDKTPNASTGLLNLTTSSSAKSGSYYFGNDGKDQKNVPFEFAILRPLNSSTFTAQLSPSAQARMTLPDIGVTTTSAPNSFQTVTTGDTITYSIELVGNKGRGTVAAGRTTTTIANFIKTVDARSTYLLNVSETIPAGTQFVSCTGGGSCSGNTLSWSNVSVADGEKKTLTYTVRVTAGLGGKVVSPKGKVWNAEDPQGYFSTNEITHLIGGTPLSAGTISPSVSSTGYGTDIATAVYRAAYGVDLQLPETDTLLGALLAHDYWPNESSAYRNKFRWRDASELTGDARTLHDMVVQNYLGGGLVMTYDENGRKTNATRLRDYSMEFLHVGDILVYANCSATTGRFEADGSDGDTYVYVYLGGNKFAYYDESGVYRTVTAPLKVVQYGTTSTHYIYSKVVTQAMLKDAFVLLRPTQAVENLLATGCDLDGVQPDVTMAVSTDGGETFGESVTYGVLATAAVQQRTETEAAAKAGGTPATYLVTLQKDLTLDNKVTFAGNVILDLNGHTLTLNDAAYIEILGMNGAGSTGNSVVKNGTVRGGYVVLSLNNSEVTTLDNCRIYANDMHGAAVRIGGNYMWGFAVSKTAGSQLNLNNCILGTLGNEKPLYCKSPSGDSYDNGSNGSTTYDNTVHIQDNVTLYVPTEFNEGENRHSGWAKDGSRMTIDGVGVQRVVASQTLALPGGTQKNYKVVRFTSGVASVNGRRYVTLDAAVTAANALAKPVTVTLVADTVLTSDVTIPAGVTVDPGEYTVIGAKIYAAPGGAYGDIAVPAGADAAELGGATYGAFLPDPALTVQQSLSLTDAVVLNAAVPDLGYASYYAWMRWEDGTPQTAVVTGEDGGDTIWFPLVEKKAKNMGDEHAVTIFAVDSAGEAHIARSTTLSIRDYADTVLDGYVDWTHDENAEAAAGKFGADLGRAMTAMLQYGAAAQTYFDYRTDELVSANLTQAMKDRVAAKYDADALAAARDEKTSGTLGETALFYGTSSILGENMALKFYFRLPTSVWTDAALAETTVCVSYVDHTGQTHITSLPATELDRNTSPNFRSYTVRELVAADIALPVTVTLSRGGRQILQVWDSVANYTGRAAAAGMGALADPMLIYGLAARDYFPYSPSGDVPVTDDADELAILRIS
ncbi:MAG: hypothetical protein IJT18_05405 [Oscillospiraceae bacterium]|nr:hypothetical protein [Oscillospiraceae bacterium]